MQKSDSIKEIAIALNKAQSEMKAAPKDSENPFFKSKYADFASVWETCRPALVKNGLSVIQATDVLESGVMVVRTTLLHTSGEWISSCYPVLPIKPDPQSLMSTLTYARRGSLSSLICLATEEDDDAESAMHRDEGQKQVEKKGLLSHGELVEKMKTSKNIFELEARAKKYRTDYDAMTGEQQVEVKKAKDRRKTEIEGEKDGK